MSEKMMDRIQKLLNQAADVGLDTPEGRAFQEKAQELMSVHKIEEAALAARSVAAGLTEQKRKEPTDLLLDWVDYFDPFKPVHTRIVAVLADLTGVELVLKFNQLHVIGYPDDIQYFRMLWLSAHLTFSSKLFPEWDKTKSAGQNIRTMVEAGYKWDYIWDKAVEVGQPFMRTSKGKEIPVPRPPADNGWMKRQLKKAYEATGEEKPQLNHGVANYRNSYAIGFQEAFTARVYQLIAQKNRIEQQASGGASLVLAKDVDAAKAYFMKLYPPGSLGSSRSKQLQGTHAGAGKAGRNAAASVDLSGGKGGVGGRGPAGALGR